MCRAPGRSLTPLPRRTYALRLNGPRVTWSERPTVSAMFCAGCLWPCQRVWSSLGDVDAVGSRAALLVIDMVNDFVTGVFGSDRAQAMVPRVAALISQARAVGVPVIYCNDSHLA